MGMSLGQLLSGAGEIASGWRQEEDAVRVSREAEFNRQQRYAEAGRLEALRRKILDAPASQGWPLDMSAFQPMPEGEGAPEPVAPVVARPEPLTAAPAGVPGPVMQYTPGAALAAPAAPAAPAVTPNAVAQRADLVRRRDLVHQQIESNQRLLDNAKNPEEVKLLQLQHQQLSKQYFALKNQANSLDLVIPALGERVQQAWTSVTGGPSMAQQQTWSTPTPLAPPSTQQQHLEQAAKTTAAADKRSADLIALLPKAVATPIVQTLTTRADALGVDPIAAMAIFGVETNFGASDGVSSAGAKGPMQVTDATFNGMKKWFTDKGNIEKYSISPEVTAAAAALVRGVPQSELDAGLLRMKYMEYIKLPRNLWGAGYQTNADNVLKAGRPLAVTDGHMTNDAYNQTFVSVYNAIASSIIGETARADVNAPRQTLAGLLAPNFVSSAQAGTLPATGGVAHPGITAGHPPPAKTPAAATNYYLANPNAIPAEIRRAVQQREEVARLAGMYQSSGMAQQYMEARAKLQDMDYGMLHLQGMQGIQELSLANDPRRLSAVWSEYAGARVDIQMRKDNLYNVFVSGKKVQDGLSAASLVDRARSAFDIAYRTQKSAASAEFSKEQMKTSLEIEKERAKSMADMIKLVAVEKTKGDMQMALKYMELNYGWDIKPTGGEGNVIIRPPGGSPFVFNPAGETVEVGGVRTTTTAARPIAGLPTYK